MTIKALSWLLLSIIIQDTCYGFQLKPWVESWLKRQGVLYTYIHSDIENRGIAGLVGNYYYFNESFDVTSTVFSPQNAGVHQAAIDQFIIVFRGLYESTVRSGNIPENAVLISLQICGEIRVHLKSFCRSEGEYNQKTTGKHNRKRRFKLLLEIPTQEDNGLLEALKPFNAVLYANLFGTQNVPDEFKGVEVNLTRIGKFETNGLIHVQAEYSCGRKTFYALYNIKLLGEDKFIITKNRFGKIKGS